MNRRPLVAATVVLVLTMATVAPACAYVGPGAGISLLGALWALIAVVGSAILYVILWPFRRWLKRRKRGGGTSAAGGTPTAENREEQAPRKDTGASSDATEEKR